jgi:hypothetical protein
MILKNGAIWRKPTRLRAGPRLTAGTAAIRWPKNASVKKVKVAVEVTLDFVEKTKSIQQSTGQRVTFQNNLSKPISSQII